MTDLKMFINMLNKSDETFTKEKSGKDWVVRITGREVHFLFNEDETFSYCYNEK